MVKITFEDYERLILERATTLWGGVTETPETPPKKPLIYGDYIYLDTDERRRFAQVSHTFN